MEREDAGAVFCCKGAVPVFMGCDEDMAEGALDCDVGSAGRIALRPHIQIALFHLETPFRENVLFVVFFASASYSVDAAVDALPAFQGRHGATR